MKLRDILHRIQNSADRDSYGPISGLAGVIDQWMPFIPLEPILIAGVIGRPLRWLRCPIWMTAGCALGGMLLSIFTHVYGMSFVGHYFPQVVEAALGPEVQDWFHRYGLWSLAALSLSPIPHAPGILLCGASGVNPLLVFGAIYLGRIIKYVTVAYLTVRTLRRIPPKGRPDSGS